MEIKGAKPHFLQEVGLSTFLSVEGREQVRMSRSLVEFTDEIARGDDSLFADDSSNGVEGREIEVAVDDVQAGWG